MNNNFKITASTLNKYADNLMILSLKIKAIFELIILNYIINSIKFH